MDYREHTEQIAYSYRIFWKTADVARNRSCRDCIPSASVLLYYQLSSAMHLGLVKGAWQWRLANPRLEKIDTSGGVAGSRGGAHAVPGLAAAEAY